MYKLKSTEKEFLKKFKCVILFGSNAINKEKKYSDIDLLLILDKKKDEKKIEEEFTTLNKNFSILLLTKKEFENRIYEFNHGLLEIFTYGVIIEDREKFFYKMKNLYLVLYHKKKFELTFRNKKLTMEKLIKINGFV